MLSWLTNAWRVPELRRRAALHRDDPRASTGSGAGSPRRASTRSRSRTTSTSQSGTILSLLNIFSGGALSQFALFALGIMPYVTASIILQLLTVVIPRLEQLQKEGEAGYAKINQYTRYLTVVLAALQALGYSYLFNRQGALAADRRPRRPDRRLAHGGDHAAHVDGRADHEAGHRQRHLAPHLRLDPRAASGRHPGLVGRRPDRAAVPADHRARDHRRGRLRPGGAAPDPDPVREAESSAAA